MFSEEELFNILRESLEANKLRKLVCSGPHTKDGNSKFSIKPIKIKEKIVFQIESFENNKAFHNNFNCEETYEYLKKQMLNFKNINLFTEGYEYIIINNKGKLHVKTKEVKSEVKITQHNNTKEYIIPEGKPIEFLIDLGIMDNSGKVNKNSYSKFRQINRYLEFIRDVVDELIEKNQITEKITVVDFGSGKSYLTFVMYYYLKYIRKFDVKVIGLDLKKDVMIECGKLAEKYGFHELTFVHGDIKEYTGLEKVDMVFSLHACNNATDYAFLKGLELQASAILAVPCCQHEFNQKIAKAQNTKLKSELAIVNNHGLLMERVSSLFTDGFRAGVMELCGYKAQVIEFIDMEHTPKNILIKCIKENTSRSYLEKKHSECKNFMNFLGIEPLIYSLLKKYFV